MGTFVLSVPDDAVPFVPAVQDLWWGAELAHACAPGTPRSTEPPVPPLSTLVLEPAVNALVLAYEGERLIGWLLLARVTPMPVGTAVLVRTQVRVGFWDSNVLHAMLVGARHTAYVRWGMTAVFAQSEDDDEVQTMWHQGFERIGDLPTGLLRAPVASPVLEELLAPATELSTGQGVQRWQWKLVRY